MFKRTLYPIRRYLGKTWGLAQYRMRTLYAAAMESVLFYACPVRGSYVRTKRGKKKLRAIERGYNDMTVRSFRSVDSGSLSVLSQTLPIDYRVIEMIRRRYLIGGFSSFPPRSFEMIRAELADLKIAPRSDHISTPDHPPWHSLS